MIYAVARLVIWWELRHLPRVKSRPYLGETGMAIDASKLAGRVEQLRQYNYANEGKTGGSLNKPLLVEEKRQQMAKLAYFQKPPPPAPPPSEPTDHEGGFSLIFV